MVLPEMLEAVLSSPPAMLLSAALQVATESASNKVCAAVAVLPASESDAQLWTPTFMTALIIHAAGLTRMPQYHDHDPHDRAAVHRALVMRLLVLVKDTLSVCTTDNVTKNHQHRNTSLPTTNKQLPALLCMRGMLRDSATRLWLERSGLLKALGDGCTRALFMPRASTVFQMDLLLRVLAELLPTQRQENVAVLLDWLGVAVVQAPVLVGAAAELCSRASAIPAALHANVRALFNVLLRQAQQGSLGDRETRQFETAHVLACLSLFCRACVPEALRGSAAAGDATDAALRQYYDSYEDTQQQAASSSPSQTSQHRASPSSSSPPAATGTPAATPAKLDVQQQQMLKQLGDGMLDLLTTLPAPPIAWPPELRRTMQRLACRLALATAPAEQHKG